MLVQTKIAWDGQVVQQLYSNPSKLPETVGNTATQKRSSLQLFCKIWKAPENYLTAFARQKAWVRIPSAPL
jgi:hypothetical protein